MIVNLFVTEGQPLRWLKVNTLSIDPTIPPNEYYKTVKGAERKLLYNDILSTTFNNKILYLKSGPQRMEPFKINGYRFTPDATTFTLNANDHNLVMANLVEKGLKLLASSKNYIRPSGQKFFQKEPYKENLLSYYDAFYGEVEVFKSGDVGIWLDPTIKWKYTLLNFLNWASKKPLTRTELEEYLIGRKVKYPSVKTNRYYNATVAKIENCSLHNYTIELEENKPQSLYSYWTKSWRHKTWVKNNNIRLDPEFKPVVLLDVPNINKPLPYPASVLEIVIDLLDPMIPGHALHEKKNLTPKQRIGQTLALYDILLRDGLNLNVYKLTFPRQLYEISQSNGQIGQIISLSAPTLIFGTNNICRALNSGQDPNVRQALFQYGPVDKKNSLGVSYVAPENERENIETFHNLLNNYASQMHLGNFTFQNFYGIDRISADRYMRICQNIKKGPDAQIIIVLLPHHHATDTYYASKRGLGRNFIRSEMVQWKTYNAILAQCKQGKQAYSLYNIALKAYGRALNAGESIWHLKSPAGQLTPELNYYFMGFDVSRNPNTRKEAAAYAAVCDSYGRFLYKNSISTHRGERVVASVLSDWFFELATTIYDDIGDGRKVDGLVLFKDGNITANQVEEYKQGALLAKERLLKEHIIHSDSDIKVVAAIKRGVHRVYDNAQNKYQVKYSALIRSPTDAILVTSRPRWGTASTTRLNLTYQSKNNMNIEQISRIFNDLRYLDWSSLYTQPKTILPLHIVQNLAKLSKEDIIVPYVPR